MRSLRRLICGLMLAAFVLVASPLWSQRIRFPSVSPGGPVVAAPPGATLGAPVETPFDPYGLGPSYGTVTTNPVPALGAPTYGAPPATTFGLPPAVTMPALPTTPGPTYQPPPIIQPTPNANPNVPPALPGPPPVLPGSPPTLTGPPYPSTGPSAIYPNGIFPNSTWTPGSWMGGVIGGTAVALPPFQRLFEDFFVRATWLKGDPTPTDSRELGMLNFEGATSLVVPGPMGRVEEIRVTPGFILHLLDGPAAPGFAGMVLGLPNQLYSTYLDGYIKPQITPQLSGELNVRAGVYTDFNHMTKDSVRLTGRGLVLVQLTPNAKIKAGVEYLDRNDIKLLPAGGILWEPNPQTRYDIYFPRPKLAKYLTTLGSNELWWYVGGEYGGGAWTVQDTPPGYKGRIDINDIRVFVGIDFTRPSDLTGFVEGGYVFEREIVYVDGFSTTPFKFNMKDTFMVRAGVIW